MSLPRGRSKSAPPALALPATLAAAGTHSCGSVRRRPRFRAQLRPPRFSRRGGLQAEIFAVVSLTRNDRLVRPLLTCAFTDRWKGTIGAEIYRGAADTQYGGLERNSGVFAELRFGL